VKEPEPKQERLTRRFLRTPVFKILISLFVLFPIASSTVVAHYYNRYARIIDLKMGREAFQHTAKIYAASPKLLTNLSDASRAKRRLVEFKDLPKVLVDAVTAGEDQNFVTHHGLLVQPIETGGIEV
jgi:membrane peptidoglycan carboxypeptidase